MRDISCKSYFLLSDGADSGISNKYLDQYCNYKFENRMRTKNNLANQFIYIIIDRLRK